MGFILFSLLLQEGAVGETSPVLTAILASLETLDKLGLNHPEVGGHRRWHALAQELEPLTKNQTVTDCFGCCLGFRMVSHVFDILVGG